MELLETLNQKQIAEHLGKRAQRGKLPDVGFKPDRLGEFDDVDLAMMIHTTSNPAEGKLVRIVDTSGRAGEGSSSGGCVVRERK